MRLRILIVGNRGGTNIGGCFERAARRLGISATLVESREATDGAAWLRRINWYLRNRRPTWLERFSAKVVRTCAETESEVAIVTGITALSARCIDRLVKSGVKVVNYLTDDPWNTSHKAQWFFEALPKYSAIFSPRKANIADLLSVGCRRVIYLPFAYDAELHYPASHSSHPAHEVVFVGGADADRVRLFSAAATRGLPLALYGDYWHRSPTLRCFWRGYAGIEALREVTTNAAVSVCLLRTANRDGHTMRSFEIPAMAGVVLAEASEDHMQIFGPEGECALYFTDATQLVDKARWLLEHQVEAKGLAQRVRDRVVSGKNTYVDRLEAMLTACATL